MKTSKFTEEQVAYALRLSESGTPVADVCRQMGISEATFYVWRKKYADLGVAELRQLRQLTEENARLKRIVADLTLDKQILQEVIKKRSDARAQEGNCIVDPRAIPSQHGAVLRAGEDHPRELVLPQPGEGPVGLEDAHSRDGERASKVRLRAHHRSFAPGRLAGGAQARTPPLQAAGPPGPCQVVPASESSLLPPRFKAV